VALVGVISTETFQAVLSQGETANPIAENMVQLKTTISKPKS
jgi:hypothetical protein